METSERANVDCAWKRLPIQAAQHNGVRLLANGPGALAILGIAWLMFPPAHVPLQTHIWVIRLGVSGVLGLCSLVFINLSVHDIAGILNAACQARWMRKHPLPEPLLHASHMLDAIPLALREASPSEAISAIMVRLPRFAPRPTVWHVGVPGYWSGTVMEYGGHILTPSGHRFVDSHQHRLPCAWAVSDMNGALLEGMKVDEDFHARATPDPRIVAHLDAWLIERACQDAGAARAPSRRL